MIFEFIGGLGIFLLGIKYMGEGLQKSLVTDYVPYLINLQAIRLWVYLPG